MSLSITFVCQAGDLEAKALLLAASLRRALDGPGGEAAGPRPESGPDVELIACLPTPEARFGRVADATRAALQALGVRTESIRNPLADDYPIGNKLACFDLPTTAAWRLFLDSDVLLTRPLAAAWWNAGIAAKPADWPTFRGGDEVWRGLYARFGVPCPTRRVVATVAGRLMWPYFNAGVVAVPAGSGFGRVWADTCRAIDADPAIPCRRPHLDQIALPIAAARAGLPFTALPEDLNFPAHLRPVPGVLPTICHYHEWEVLAREPGLRDLVRTLFAEQPAVAAAIERVSGWTQLVATCRRADRRPREPAAQSSRGPAGIPAGTPIRRSSGTAPGFPDAILTGIPRSGTSHLCRLLDQLEDHAVLNEPHEVLETLASTTPTWRMPLLYRDWRRRILGGEPIPNKVVAGQLVDDTLDHNRRGDYLPTVGRDDFVLWTKNTLAYLARLDHLRRVMPWVTIVAAVRHPADTIGSWIRSFAHLRDAAVASLPIGGPDDPWLDGFQRAALRQIADCAEAPLRRALWWRFLAEEILARRETIAVVRYEDVVADPVGTTGAIARLVPDGPAPRFRTVAEASAPRHSRDLLSPADHDAIRDICGQPAGEFGYDL